MALQRYQIPGQTGAVVSNKNANLLSFPSLVESPFIIVKIGDIVLGDCTVKKNELLKTKTIRYPNYMQSIDIKKINGVVNTYTIVFEYKITTGEDPNYFERLFSVGAKDRKILISYGDWASPLSSYKDEEAIIINVTSNVSIPKSSITYTISAVSNALKLNSNVMYFSARNDKPSNVIRELITNSGYGLRDIFTGMKDSAIINNLIASDDKRVNIPVMQTTPLTYLSFLVSCMQGETDNTIYSLIIDDNISNNVGGVTFRVVKIDSNTYNSNSLSTYEVDVGYPENNFVTNFSVKSSNAYSILYDYSDELNQNNYLYKINNDGVLTTTYSPSLARSKQLNEVTPNNQQWWNKMTQFPITASLTIKGLLRPALLMQYVKINTYFYGRKHISSGLYIITEQNDHVDGSGYRTTLSLSRIGADEN